MMQRKCYNITVLSPCFLSVRWNFHFEVIDCKFVIRAFLRIISGVICLQLGVCLCVSLKMFVVVLLGEYDL